MAGKPNNKQVFYDSPVLENKLLSPYRSFAGEFSLDDDFRKKPANTTKQITDLFHSSSNMQLPMPGPVKHPIFILTMSHLTRFESEINVMEGDINRYVLAFTYVIHISPIFKGPLQKGMLKELTSLMMKFHNNRITANTLFKKGTKDVCTLEEKFAILGKESAGIHNKLTDEEKSLLTKQTSRYVFEFSNPQYNRVAHLLANGYMSACVAVGIKNTGKTFELYMNAHNAHKRNHDGVLFLAV